MYKALLDQLFDASDVDRTPCARKLATREPDAVAHIVNPPSDAIDPAEAQGCIDRLRPGDAWLAGILLIEADQQFSVLMVMFLEPPAPSRRSRKELRFHRLQGYRDFSKLRGRYFSRYVAFEGSGESASGWTATGREVPIRPECTLVGCLT